MSVTSKGVFVIGAKRTPFCKYGGSLRELPASHAFAAAAKEAIRSACVNPNNIDNTVIGNVNFLSQCDGGKTPRYCGIYSGVPLDKPALGVSKACGTGIQTIINGAVDILTGLSNISLTGGTEIMTSLPMLARNVRFGTTLGTPVVLEDHIKNQFLDSYTGLTLQKIAEDLAKRYGFTRKEVDAYALESYLRCKAGHETKIFDKELAGITVNIMKKDFLVKTDEIRNMCEEDLTKSPTLLEDGSIVTTNNSAGPADGAAALLLASEEALKSHQLKPLARIVSWACVGVDPTETGMAAVPAVKRLLADAGMTVDEVDLFEINDTFASQLLASAKELGIDLSKINVNGGALSLGHPIAATGARMAIHLVHQLGVKYKRGIAASACGGGQGVAIMFERI